MKTMLERLFSHLHRAVFDTSADEITAFKLDGPKGSSWIAKDEFFDITFADGSVKQFNLNDYQIYQFIDALKLAGMTVTGIEYDCLYFSAITMLELTGAAGKPNRVVLYKDILHAIFGAYSREMREAKDNVQEAIKQMEIPTANDGFLNQWGDIFSAVRTDGMDDPAYRAKIKRVAFRKRVNSYAIEQVVKEDTGYNITLEEPWRDIFRLDISQLSGTHEFYKGDQTGYFLVQPVSYNAVDWDKILPIVRRNLAAGIQILKPAIRGMFIVEDPLAGAIWYQNWSMMAEWVKTDSMPKLDNGLILSGTYEIQRNYEVSIDSNYAVFYSIPVRGDIRRDSSRIRASDVIWGNVPVFTWHTGNKLGDWLQMYPEEPRTWQIGKWDEFATWSKPYSWAVWSRATKNESAFLVADVTEDANGNVISIESWLQPVVIGSQGVQGWGWEDPQEWSSDRWDKGSEITYYILAAPAKPQDAGEFKLDVRSHVSSMTITHELKNGPMRFVATRYDESDDSPVSGGMKDSLGRNTDDTVATFTQEANGYGYNLTPLALGTTTFTIYDPNYPGVKLELTVKIIERIPWTDATTPSVTTIPWTELEQPVKVPWTPINDNALRDIPATKVTLAPLTVFDSLAGLHHDMQPFTLEPSNARGYTMKWEICDSLGMPYPATMKPTWITIDETTGVWDIPNLPGSTLNSTLKVTITNADGSSVSDFTRFDAMVYVLAVTHNTTSLAFGSTVGGRADIQLNWQPKDANLLSQETDVEFEMLASAGNGPAIEGITTTFERDYKFAGQPTGGMLHINFPKGIPVGTYRGWLWPTYKGLVGGKFSFLITVR